MSNAPAHRQLILPDPGPERDGPTAREVVVALTMTDPTWIELHRGVDDAVDYHLGAHGPSQLSHTFHSLAEVFPGLELGPNSPCPFSTLRRPETVLYRALPVGRHHFWPMRLVHGSDRAGLLLHSLAEKELHGHELLLQVLFRRVPYWESGFLSGSYERFALERVPDHDRHLATTLHRRKAEPAYHVEIRAAAAGPEPRLAAETVVAWLRSWASSRGSSWWRLLPVEGRRRPRFLHAFRDHDMLRFAAPRARRDVSATELAQVLPIPWREHIPGLSYAGAPRSSGPQSLAVRPNGDSGGRGIAVGRIDGEAVCLPEGWHHLAILGKTRSGKSTLALNLVAQLLSNEPRARVVVLEPTGNLIRGLVERLPSDVARDTVEIDPSHPTFERDGMEMAAVPLNLLHLRDRRPVGTSELERRVERLSGDLLQAIRNAWGEESIGGRAEFVLRAVLQGLLTVPGTNFVDAYQALSDKHVLRRVERLSEGVLLRDALGHHLPRLGYEFTFSSLDKVGKVATNPLLRKALCQRYHTVGFDQLLGSHRLLLLNLAKGSLGSETSTFLGAIFLTQLWSAIQELGLHDSPTYLVVDEFHNYAIPAFADMLSEGASHGLHVIAITQYLDRIPEKVRTALVGNVDSWAFFPVGAEDAKDVWQIAQGPRFGWKPEHFTGGLGPHQAACSMAGELLKLDTCPVPRVLPSRAEANIETVRENVRRYARPEDSQESPLAISLPLYGVFLETFPDVLGLTPLQISAILHWPASRIDAALALALASGDVAEGQSRDGIEYGLRARGHFYREALAKARNEGEEHCGLLADAAADLRSLGIRVSIVAQQGGFLRPDGEFRWRGQDYHLEVECSTLIKHQEQVARNVSKAITEGRRCLVAVANEEMARVFASVLLRELPKVELWREVGILWREGIERMVPYESGTRKPWGFLRGGVDGEQEEEPTAAEDAQPERMVALSAADDPLATDLARAYERARRLQERGRMRVTATDFKELTEGDNGNSMSLRRLGMALSSLGIRSQRVMRDGVQVREYDLRTLVDRSGQRRAYPGDPTGKDAKDASEES